MRRAWGMGQGSNNAARKDALIKFIEEDCATGMELRSPDEKYAAKKDTRIKLSMECVCT